MPLPELLHPGEHRHICPQCEDTWWHDAIECEDVWAWDCPIHIGLGRASLPERHP